MRAKIKETEEIKSLFKIIREETGYNKAEIQSKYRIRELVTVRIIIGVIMVETLEHTTMQVGTVINKDHSTVVYYKAKHRQHYELEKKYKETFDTVKRRFINEVLLQPKPRITERTPEVKIYLLQSLVKDILIDDGITSANKEIALELI